MNARQIKVLLEPGSLWQKALSVTETALQSGAIKPISTRSELVRDGALDFSVQIASNVARKAEVQARQANPKPHRPNPFLPYDQRLFVSDIFDTHLCLLNKYKVIDNHLLVVTRSFEPQENLLTMGDFAALWQCLAEKEALVFYNAGKIAGASQSHKHLQLIALPIANANPQLPIQRLLEALSGDGSPRIVAGLPWVHRALRWPFEPSADPFAKAEFSFRQYRTMLADVGLNGTLEPETCPQAGPYNLLATREWMILIPRSSELFDSISINALGFAGTFFLKDEEQLRKLREAGPMAALRSVGVPWSADALSKSIR